MALAVLSQYFELDGWGTLGTLPNWYRRSKLQMFVVSAESWCLICVTVWHKEKNTKKWFMLGLSFVTYRSTTVSCTPSGMSQDKSYKDWILFKDLLRYASEAQNENNLREHLVTYWTNVCHQPSPSQSTASIKGQPESSSSVRIFPRWTLVLFWSTSLGRRITDEVTSCLFGLDLRDRLQMWQAKGSGVPWKEIATASPFRLVVFPFLRDSEGRLNVAVCKWFYFFWEAAVKWPKYTEKAFISEPRYEPAICTKGRWRSQEQDGQLRLKQLLCSLGLNLRSQDFVQNKGYNYHLSSKLSVK